MSSLWFVMPASGRLQLAQICMRQLRRTVDALEQEGIHASAVVIADDENLDTARELGFATVERDNQFVSRKFNDGIQLACDPAYNPHPAKFVVPVGSDDWVDWRLFVDLPHNHTPIGFQRMSFVREDGRELVVRRIANEGGCGIRIYSRQLMKAMGYRPADEDRKRGCDTSILVNMQRQLLNVRFMHRDLDPLQIVDWKSPGENLNPYVTLARHKQELAVDPFKALKGLYPAVALREMRVHYSHAGLVAA